MNAQFKLGLYVVTVVGTLVFGALFVRGWRQWDAGAQATRPATNAVAVATNTPSPAGEATSPAETTPEREPVPLETRLGSRGSGFGRVLVWGLLGLASVVGLGFQIAFEVAQYAGGRATQVLFDDEGEALPESLYEQVEKAYGNGDYLEAIRLLRDFLKVNPKAAHAQIRIAEIYEKDLNNPLAAALEYEEVLKRPLPVERRSWAAIHLVNLYNRLDKPKEAVAWLQRIVVECPDTPAAAKARDRLEASGMEIPEAPAASASASVPEEPPTGLPPGFRPRGG